ncbi:cyclophilin-like fold protein [Paenibacillus sp. An7]|uniref:cyclophilin-like fold protein n=1 Tax=Paenibacillus sp. An7 TaxID=2689577 RepID=UPI001916EA99|nr:cyclophilin-like fold protein [Paenibacillus sp. An7]
MKYIKTVFILIMIMIILSISLVWYVKGGSSTLIPLMTSDVDSIKIENDMSVAESNIERGGEIVTTLNIQIGSEIFTATLYNNASTQSLLAQMPLTLNMSDVNRNEKYAIVPVPLPTATERVKNINAGDIMLYGSDGLVLFYKTFSTTYSYTRLGYIEDISRLTNALSDGNTEVTLSIIE